MTNELHVTREVYLRLKKRYEQAVAAGEETFVFDGHELLTNYAKYLLEYMAPHFAIPTDPTVH